MFSYLVNLVPRRKKILTALSKALHQIRLHFFKPRYSHSRVLISGLLLFWIGFVAGITILVEKHLIPLIFAAPASYTWNLSSAGNYTVSDSSLLEVTGNIARLKLRQYADDDATQLWLSFDGSSSDGASPAQTVTASNVTYTSTDAYFTQAGVFNGSTSKVVVDDSSEISMTGGHTLETWVKFPGSGFGDNTSDYNQTLFDKGSYRLYFEASTGKLAYEASDPNANTWSQKAGANLDGANGLPVSRGSWDLDGKPFIYSTVKLGSYIFVALGNTTTSTNDAEVWRCTGCETTTPTWEKIAGYNPSASVTVVSNFPPTNAEWLTAMKTDGTNLYVGMGGTTAGDAEVWRCSGCTTNSITWTKVGGDTVNASWANSTYETVNTMAISGNDVYVGLGNTANSEEAEIWRCQNCATSPTWGGTRIGGNGINSSWGAAGNYEEVASMTVADVSGTPYLVVGLANTGDASNSDAEVWSTSLGSLPTVAWTKNGGDGSGTAPQSWASTQYDRVSAMVANGDDLYVGLGTTDNEAEIWYCPTLTSCTATTGWQKIGEGVGASWTTSAGFNTVRSLAMDSDTLYVGLGDANGEADVYRCVDCDNDGAGRTWSKIGGDSATGIPDQSWGTLYQRADSLLIDGGVLYVGLSSGNRSAELWRCTTPATCSSTTGWNKVGGNYYAGSWEARNLIGANKMTAGDGKLFVGSSSTVAGNAYVWAHDPVADTWLVVGGAGRSSSSQSTTLGWDSYTNESVTSAIYYKGALYVGLGTSTNDAEVWRCTGCENGSPSWVKVGGDGVNSSWNTAYETVPSMAIYNGQLYIGLGSSAAGDAEVWRCTGCDGVTPSWGGARIGGDDPVANGSTNFGWNAAGKFEVSSMVVHKGFLFVGVSGTAVNNAEVWRYNGTSWSTFATTGAIGGDGNNSSWNTLYERVDSLAVYNDQLYAGLGLTAGDAEIWRCTGCEGGSPSWGGTRIGGDDSTGTGSYGWLDGTYERVFDMVTYNGELYASLGLSVDEGEVWKFTGSNWSQAGGDGVANGWTAANDIDYVASLAVVNGSLYAGTGGTANNDAMVWRRGNNTVARSDVLSLTADTWYHLAAINDGTHVKLYLNGVQSGLEKDTLNTLPDTSQPLLIGMGYGNMNTGGSGFGFNGQMDVVRISNTARNTSDLITSPYAKNIPVTIQPTSAVLTSQVKNWNSFSVNDSASGGSIRYRLSSDNGTTWKRWNGSDWVTATTTLTADNYTSESNDEATISTNIGTFPVGTGGVIWQAALLDPDGDSQVQIVDSSPGTPALGISYEDDTEGPKNPSSVTAFDETDGEIELTSGNYYNYTQPSFVLPGEEAPTGATDQAFGDSGIKGYWVLLSTSSTADPQTEVAAEFITGTVYTPTLPLTASGTYYLRVKAQDNAQNPAVSRDGVDGIVTLFTYNFDDDTPNQPIVSVSPSGYASTNNFTFTWSAAEDVGGAGIAGYKYKTNAPSGALSDWSSTITDTSVTIPDAAHTTGQNYFYLKTIDVVGNESSTYQIPFYFGGTGPSAVQNLRVVGNDTNTSNNFEFTWDAPQTFSSASVNDLRYCYAVNAIPTQLADCTMTSLRSISGALATRVDQNTLYVLARDSDDVGGSINYGNVASVIFTADTSAPGIPLSADVADISIKSSETWRLTVSWSPPTDAGSGVSYYKIFRSIDGDSYTLRQDQVNGTAYVDTGLEQLLYYYKVKACDNVDNCGSDSTVVSATPTGKYLEPAVLTSGPTAGTVTTKAATIAWTTDRAADSRIQYGTSAGNYFTSEPSKSLQETDHSVPLTNLQPGTTYYYRVKWTDEDGNTGVSSEKTFTTSPAPSISEVKVKNIGLDTAYIEFNSTGAESVKVYYGKTSGFGGVKTISTGSSGIYTVQLEELEDGAKYYFKINAVDEEDAEYEGTILDFTTLPRPEISKIRVQQVRNAAKPTILVTWNTNTPTSSIVTYYPESNPEAAQDEVNVNLSTGQHRIIVRGLLPESPYIVVVKGRDKAGNEARSTPQRLTTATDTRPALISDLKIEGTIQSNSENKESNAQLVVSWTTDEPATSQVEFGDGTGTTYSQKTQEDTNLTINHLVVITGLRPSNVYHLRALSRDAANNLTESVDTVTITPKATDNALDLVVNNLQQVFGFLKTAQ